MMIYRPGAVTAEQIRAIAGPVEIFRSEALRDTPREAMPSPGVGLRHYAPRARLVLVEGEAAELWDAAGRSRCAWPVERVGVMLPAEFAGLLWARWSLPGDAGPLRKSWRGSYMPGCGRWMPPVAR